jgi:phosphoglucosamine mutase
VICLLFGTDGIRGKVITNPEKDSTTIDDLQKRRCISPRLIRLVGEALTRIIKIGDTVIVGWDNRPDNPKLVNALTQGLHLGGCKVIHAGNCATPGLHNAILKTESALGCMITASHNPVTDSGIKVFDNKGFKTDPETELIISELVMQLAAEDREIDDDYLVDLAKSDSVFNADFAHQEILTIRFAEFTGMFASPNSKEILLDSSKGAGSIWLAQMLKEFGIDAIEISHEAAAMNEKCGAGELSPTDSWTWTEAKNSDHLLIQKIEPAPAGEILAAALDGDGDRCLFVISTGEGCAVLDGDGMADHILRAGQGNWHVAASIESDLSLCTSLDRLDANVEFTQTAVGDRWLSHALRDSDCSILGIEDSGHLVMSAPNPNGGRTIVGDGAASLLAVLCAMAVENKPPAFERGFKQRIAINGSNRSLWTGENKLANEVESIAIAVLGNLTRGGLDGEPNLMMLESEGVSIGIRNSGTQAKTNVSLRVVSGIDIEKPILAAQRIVDYLRNSLM